ncbi:gaf domaincontaining protein [Plasmopara halstedii]|uniref:Gaf domaincontaining protein n=1 Tax=Plasmopara halstedii TaxID=4781 RepID=A0A0P1B367_PLAHL|nr:gaf domaincontaining protein [Plasmopara halstedii]CEG48917.1 gaf domaincontaining protein [Plasmopara halstedii]|eukprot:XP_024585286.1 gaf domaincontaining protein [Plasmopara halstedii]
MNFSISDFSQSMSRTSRDFKDEDIAVVALAAKARATVEASQHVFVTLGWKERKDGQGVRLFERKSTPGVFDIAASTSLPCSASEIIEALSSRNSDEFNATMLALAGDGFSFAVTLREIPTASPHVHLTIKRMQFSGSIPLVSSTKTFEFLDYAEYDTKTRTAVRIFQTLTRDRAGRLALAGDTLAGYVLTEQTKLHQTSVFYFGTHAMTREELKARSIVKARLRVSTARESTTQALLKLAKVIPTIGAIALRRRLGAEYVVDPSEEGNKNCPGCGKVVNVSRLRKKHVCCICSLDTCNSCSRFQDVESLIGVIERLCVCCICISTARHRAFDTVNDGPTYRLRPSATSTSRTNSTTLSSTRSHVLPTHA